jgi:hypothetical protein
LGGNQGRPPQGRCPASSRQSAGTQREPPSPTTSRLSRCTTRRTDLQEDPRSLDNVFIRKCASVNLQSWEPRKIGFTSCRRYRWDVWVMRAATARVERSCTARIVAWLRHLQKSSQNLLALSNGEVIGHSMLQVRGLCVKEVIYRKSPG